MTEPPQDGASAAPPPAPADGATAERHRDATLASSLSSSVVRIFAEYTGRGPTKARSIVARDMVAVVLEDTLTRGERKLVEAGEEAIVITARRIQQSVMRDELVATVEALVGRPVHAFLSDQQVVPDVAVETFILARETQAPAG